jgi:hypothetical protein
MAPFASLHDRNGPILYTRESPNLFDELGDPRVLAIDDAVFAFALCDRQSPEGYHRRNQRCNHGSTEPVHQWVDANRNWWRACLK